MRFFHLFLFLSILSVCLSQRCQSCQNCWADDRAPTPDKLIQYHKLIDSLLDLNKQNLELWAKCKSERFVALENIVFSQRKFSIKKYENVSLRVFFRKIAEYETCGGFRDCEDELPDTRYVDQSRTLKKFYDKNPNCEFEAFTWKKALHYVKNYLSQCSNKEHVLDLDIFKKNGPGTDVEAVTFIPKTKYLSDHQFVYDFIEESETDQLDVPRPLEDKVITPLLIDLLKFIDTHFKAQISTFVYTDNHHQISVSPLKHTEDPRGPQGFQLIQRKSNFPFMVLKDLKVKLSLVGNLILYVFDSNGKLKETETVKGLCTKGVAWITLSDMNIVLQDKDIVMLGYEGEGALEKRESEENLEIFGLAKNLNVMLMNYYIKRDNFEKPKIGQQYALDNTKITLDAELVLIRSGDGEKRKAATVSINQVSESEQPETDETEGERVEL